MKRSLKLLAIVISLILVTLGVFVISAGAETTYAAVVTDLEDNELGSYATFKEAANAAKEQGGGKITLLSDCELDFTYYFAQGGYYLDLNGKQLICDCAIVLGVEDTAFLTIDDSGSGGTIRTNEPTSQAIYNYGDLTIEGGDIYGAMGIMSFVGDNRYPATLIINGGHITGNGYAAIDTKSTAIINGGSFEARQTFSGINNQGDLTINYCELIAKCPLYNYEGNIRVNGGIFEGIEGPAIYMVGGEVTVSGGVFVGVNNANPNQCKVAQINDGCILNLKGGIYPNGFCSNKALTSLLPEGYSFYGADYRAINPDGAKLEIEGECRVYPADALAVVIDSYGNCIKGFDSVNSAIGYAVENGGGIIVLRDTDENITDIPSGVHFYAGGNLLSGNVVNHGVIDGGAFAGEVTNHGHIYSGSYSGAVHNKDGGKIYGGSFDCEVTLEAGSLIQNNGYISTGDHYKLTNNAGSVQCTSHIGSATCISDGVCLVCGEKFADKDPNAHKAQTTATCIALAVCEYCEEEFGELADHVYNDGGDCITAGCGVRAIVKVGNRFYLDLDVAFANADTNETVYVLRDFEIIDALIPEGKRFDSNGFIITVTEGDVTVCGTVAFGYFVLTEGRVISVEPEGTILGGNFTNDVNNRGSVRGGRFNDCTIYNTGYIYNDNSMVFIGDTTVENISGSVDCYTHFGGVATCCEYPICAVCEVEYGDFAPDHHVNSVEDAEVPPTCTKTGLTAGSHCEDCDEVIVVQEEIPALGHADKAVAGRSASCTEKGLTSGTKCSVCGAILTAQNEIAAIGHKYDNACDGDCNTCGEARTPAEHYSENADGKCDACGESFELSGGAVAGIAVGSTAAVGVGGFSLFWFVIKKRKWSDLVRAFKKQ